MPTILLNFSCLKPLAIPKVPAVKTDTADVANGTRPRSRISAATDFSDFRGKSLLCLVDGDNWDIALRNFGLKVRYGTLLSRLRGLAERLCAVAVITSNPGDRRHEDALGRCGWRVLSIPRQTIGTWTGMRKVANADADLCFELGVLSSVTDYTAAIIGTGDGDLAVSCSMGLKRACGNRRVSVHALSVTGASSSRLRDRRDLFASSILLGMDLLEPIPADHSKVFSGGFRNGRNAFVHTS